MNNLKKLGVSALAGSLIAVGAQAGEMAVGGSANFTYKTKSDNPGKGIGTNKGFTVSGAGELDNGWTFSIYTAFSDALGLTSHATSLTMGSLGTITAGEGWGGNRSRLLMKKFLKLMNKYLTYMLWVQLTLWVQLWVMVV